MDRRTFHHQQAYLAKGRGIICFLVVLTLVTGCEQKNDPTPDAPDLIRNGDTVTIPDGSPLREKLKFEKAKLETIARQLTTPASVEADPSRFAQVYPPLAGHIVKLYVHLDDQVKEGQLLATLDSPDYMQAQSDYAKAKSAAALTEKTLNRTRDLLANGIDAQRDLEVAQDSDTEAKSELDRAGRRLQSFGMGLTDQDLGKPLSLFSPLEGRVIDISSGLGEFHNDPTAPIMTVADLSTVWLTANVQEKDLHLISKGQAVEATFAAYPQEVFKGSVLSIGDIIDLDTRASKVRIAFPNPDGRLKVGMFASVKFIEGSENVVLIPSSAIFQTGDKLTVFVETAPWQYESREVHIGGQEGNQTIILDGVQPDTMVVSFDGILLK